MKYNGKYSLKNILDEGIGRLDITDITDKKSGQKIEPVAFTSLIRSLDSGLDDIEATSKAKKADTYFLWISGQLQTSEADVVNNLKQALADYNGIDVTDVTYAAVKPATEYTAGDLTKKNRSGTYDLHSYNWPGGSVSFIFRYRDTAPNKPSRQGAGGRGYEDSLRANLVANLGGAGIESIEGDLKFDIGFKCGDKIIGIECKVPPARSPSKSGIGWDGKKFIAPGDADEAIISALAGFAASKEVQKRIKAFLGTMRISGLYRNSGKVPLSWGIDKFDADEYRSSTYGKRTPSGKGFTNAAKRINQFVNKASTDRLTWNDFGSTDSMPGTFLNSHYSKKGVNYIQIPGYGLYKLSDADPLGLGVDELSGLKLDTALRLRSDGRMYKWRIEAQIKFDGIPKSSFDLDDSADNKTFTDKLKKLCNVNESKLFEWAVK